MSKMYFYNINIIFINQSSNIYNKYKKYFQKVYFYISKMFRDNEIYLFQRDDISCLAFLLL